MLDDSMIANFKTSLRGRLIQRTDQDFDEIRRLYNAMINKKPLLIAQCADVADVIYSVRFGREHNLLTAIRCGGHNGPGLGSCDDGLVIDLSLMKGIRVDPANRSIRAQGGCTQGDLEHAGHAFGLAVPAGVISTTGIGGLTLGGGHGYLARRYGLTIDNLIEADVVLADGDLVHASISENEDLFWALRGGGGNFGVVTSFKYKAHPISTIFGGPVFWDLKDAPQVMKWYRQFLPQAPADLYVFLGLQTIPSTDPFPKNLWGRRICVLVICFTGPLENAEEAIKPVRKELPPPVLELAGPMPFPALQSLFDPLFPKGLQWYWKGDFVKELSDKAIDVHINYAAKAPSELSLMHLYPVDGAVHSIHPNQTAWSCRDATWSMVIAGVDRDPAKADAIKTWTKEYWQALYPYNMQAAYVNFMWEEGQDRIRATYGQNYDRLTKIKKRYDPTNFFRVNQNIKPA